MYHRNCNLPHCYSITASAGRLSAFAGVLTALTFSAIVFLLSRARSHRSELSSTAALFIAAFVSLIFATYLYTDAAAEEVPSFRAAAVSFAASLALGVALLQLFLGIAYLVRQHGGSRFVVRLAGLFVGPAIFYFLMATAVNAWGLAMTSQDEWHSRLASTSEIFFTVWIFCALLPWPTLRRLKPKVWATLSLTLVAISTFFVGYWGEEAPTTGPSAGVYVGAMAALFLLGIGYSSLLRTTIEKDARPSAGGLAQAVTTRPIPQTFERLPPP